MVFDPDRPFNGIPNLPPRQDTEPKAVLRSCIAARAALAELRVSGELIPNLAVLINSFPLLEAQASSEIENIVTTTDKLFRYAGDIAGRADPATRETLRYRSALRRGFEMPGVRPVSTAIVVQVCRTIKGVELDIRGTPGTAQVKDTTGEVVFTPPEGEEILRGKLSNWERYMHYQFEAVHPFIDGNGRTGRVLNLLYLVDKGLLDIPVLYLSRHIIRNKPDYYRLLLEVTVRQNWEEWILFMLEAVTSLRNGQRRKSAPSGSFLKRLEAKFSRCCRTTVHKS
ncbi:MAG: Fic family protein [Rhodobacteraceae bacterium]|nr:Fic family protein [Paracoccaceae bacterium]